MFYRCLPSASVIPVTETCTYIHTCFPSLAHPCNAHKHRHSLQKSKQMFYRCLPPLRYHPWRPRNGICKAKVSCFLSWGRHGRFSPTHSAPKRRESGEGGWPGLAEPAAFLCYRVFVYFSIRSFIYSLIYCYVDASWLQRWTVFPCVLFSYVTVNVVSFSYQLIEILFTCEVKKKTFMPFFQ